MEQSGFVLQEKFGSQTEERRRESFQKAFERYIVDTVFGVSSEKFCE